MSAIVGYVVLSKRPDTKGGYAYDTAGSLWPRLEPVQNHRAWCEDHAAANAAEYPERYGDIEYVVGEIRAVSS